MADISENSVVIVTENALDKHYEYLKDPSSYKVYKQRWFLLFIIAVINFTNALVSSVNFKLSPSGQSESCILIYII